MNHYKELKEADRRTDAIENESLLRYMIDVIYNCDKKLTTDQKVELFKSYKQGEEYPDISYLPSDLYMNIEETIKTKEDVIIPAEQAEIHERANLNGSKFKATFDKYAAKTKAKLEKDAQGINLFGINLNKFGSTAKFLYIGIIVLIAGYLFKVAAGVVFKEDKVNPKHMPSKKGKNKKKK